MGRSESVAVVTSCYGGYDPIVAPVEQDIKVEWLCVTDQTDVPAPWQPVIEPRPHLHPRMAAKVARCRPDLYTDADYTIWLDTSGRLSQPSSAQRLVVEGLDDRDLAQFVHPERSDILAEAEVSAGMKKYAGQPCVPQVNYYRSQGYPIGFGLWATGCIVRKNTDTMRRFGDAWLVEMMRWTWQDQLSEPFVLWSQGLHPAPLPGNLWSNPLVSFNYEQRRRDD